MHEGRRPFVHLLSFHLKAAEPARAGAGGPEGNGRFGPEAPKGRILVNGPGGGAGRLPGESGCDILELRIWYKNRSTAAGLALPDVCAKRILFF